MPSLGIPRKLIGQPRDNIERAWRTACIKAGFPTALVHDCRWSAIRTLIGSGVPQSVARVAALALDAARQAAGATPGGDRCAR